MGQLRWWILALAVAIMAGIALRRYTPRPMEPYTTFTSQHLHVRFDHPQGWKVHEITKPSTDRLVGGVQVFGPRREDLSYNPYINVSVEAVSPSATLETAAKAALARYERMTSYRLLEQAAARCAGQPAMRVSAAYQLALPLEGLNRKAVEFRELSLYCLRQGQLFRLSFAAPLEDVERYRHAFDRLVRSFTFLP